MPQPRSVRVRTRARPDRVYCTTRILCLAVPGSPGKLIDRSARPRRVITRRLPTYTRTRVIGLPWKRASRNTIALLATHGVSVLVDLSAAPGPVTASGLVSTARYEYEPG